MARANSGFVCHVHTTWVSYEDHHVHPLGYHGPDTRANKIRICPNAHSDIHFLMERLLRGKPVNLNEYGASIRHYAQLGVEQILAYAKAQSQTPASAYPPLPLPVTLAGAYNLGQTSPDAPNPYH